MGRKTLLNEGEIRKFMKLAQLSPITPVRLSEMGYAPGQRDEEEIEDVEAAEVDLGGGEELGIEDEEEVELGAEDEMGLEDEGGGEMVSVDDFMDALETALEDTLGEPTSVEMDTGEEEEIEAGEEELALGPEGGEEEMMGAEEEEVVAEVARRVAARLMNEKRSDDMATQLAERIFKRLTK